MRPLHHHHVGVGYLQVLRLGGITRCTGGVLTHLAWRLLTGHPNGGPLSCSPGVTGRLGAIISAWSSLPPVTVSILSASGHRFVGSGVKGDSHPRRLPRWLNPLLVWGGWLTPGRREWLVQRGCHLRSL